ncbi:MAG: ribosome maturation factor RimP [Deltaproteobacteria bacterium]|nr:ribosome maturation factor RimP [Deltaproteobacteria bacterium]
MRVDPYKLRSELDPLAEVHGVELVALEWLQGPGRGILRVYIDFPGGDPRKDPTAHPTVSAEQCAQVSRDVSAALDALDLIPGAYDLEVSSPGFSRPLQKRNDFNRFAGLPAKLKLRQAVDGRLSFEGTLAGTEAPLETSGGAEDASRWLVKVCVEGGKMVSVPSWVLTRAQLLEAKRPPAAKPGKGSRAAREKVPGGVSAAGPVTTHAPLAGPDEGER